MIAERLRREAEKEGVTIEEIVVARLSRRPRPPERAEARWEAARYLLRSAREELA